MGEFKICPTCHRAFEEKKKGRGVDPLTIPLSEYHVRCVLCQWPVDKRLVDAKGRCRICMRKER